MPVNLTGSIINTLNMSLNFKKIKINFILFINYKLHLSEKFGQEQFWEKVDGIFNFHNMHNSANENLPVIIKSEHQ